MCVEKGRDMCDILPIIDGITDVRRLRHNCSLQASFNINYSLQTFKTLCRTAELTDAIRLKKLVNL